MRFTHHFHSFLLSPLLCPTNRSANHPTAHPADYPTTQQTTQPLRRPPTHPPQPPSRPPNHPADHPAIHPNHPPQPPTHSADHPATQLITQPPSRPADHPPTHSLTQPTTHLATGITLISCSCLPTRCVRMSCRSWSGIWMSIVSCLSREVWRTIMARSTSFCRPTSAAASWSPFLLSLTCRMSLRCVKNTAVSLACFAYCPLARSPA